MGVLRELEQVHKELEGEHIQDWVAKGELERMREIQDRENTVSKAAMEAEVLVLAGQIQQIEELISKVKERLKKEEAKTPGIQKLVDAPEKQEMGLTEKAKELRKENEGLIKDFNQAGRDLKTHHDETEKVLQ